VTAIIWIVKDYSVYGCFICWWINESLHDPRRRCAVWINLCKLIPANHFYIFTCRKWYSTSTQRCWVQVPINIIVLIVISINILNCIREPSILRVLSYLSSVIKSRSSVPMLQWTHIATPVLITIPYPVGIVESK
jgi:hypothetical protein